jgi:hypothetical protein
LLFVPLASECTLAHHDLEVVLLGLPVPHIAPVNPHGDRAIRDGESAPSAGTTLEETPSLFSQLGFAAFGDLQGILPPRLDVQGNLEWQKVGERLDGQPRRDEGGPRRLQEEQCGGG